MIKNLKNLYSYLELTKDQLSILIQDIPASYNKFKQKKMKYGLPQRNSSGGFNVREIFSPVNSLKYRQKKLATLLSNIPLPGYMFGAVPGKDNIKNAKQHLRQKFFLKVDLKNFFPNIFYTQVYTIFLKYGFSFDVARILTKIATYEKKLPQGSPCSPIISNLVFLETAKELHEFSRKKGIVFSCFLDDLTFSSKFDFKNSGSEILKIITKNHFFPSHKKIQYREDSCEINGLMVRGNNLSVLYKMKRRAKENHYLNKYVLRVLAANK